MSNAENRDLILEEIIELELEMFLATPNVGGQSDCQKRPTTFRLMRGMAHSVHRLKFLISYLKDLKQAKQNGRNFMIEKYARMDNLIPPLNDSPLLDEISDAETTFMEDASKMKPNYFKDFDNGTFRNYLRCELETLSHRSLLLYLEEIKNALKMGRNLVLERQAWLEKKLNIQTQL